MSIEMEMVKFPFTGIEIVDCKGDTILEALRIVYDDIVQVKRINGGTYSRVYKIVRKDCIYAMKVFKWGENYENEVEEEINIHKKMDKLGVVPKFHKVVRMRIDGEEAYGIIMDLYQMDCFTLLYEYNFKHKLAIRNEEFDKVKKYEAAIFDVIRKMIEVYEKSIESGHICMDVKPSNFVVNVNYDVGPSEMKLDELKAYASKMGIQNKGDKRKRDTWVSLIEEYNTNNKSRKDGIDIGREHDVKIIDFTSEWVFNGDIDCDELEDVKHCLKTHGHYDCKTFVMFMKTFAMLIMSFSIVDHIDLIGGLHEDVFKLFKKYWKTLKANDNYNVAFIKTLIYNVVFKDWDVKPLFHCYMKILIKNKNLKNMELYDKFYKEINHNVLKYGF